jgi:HAD superfamily hydrolase (TIGR01549 family)
MVLAKNIKLIIFDFDGTLHTLPIDWQKMREVAGIAGSSESLGAAIERFKKEKSTEILEKISKVEEESLKNEELDAAVKETLKKLQSKYDLAILSRNSGIVIEAFLKANGIEKIYTIGREDVDKLKPDPEGIYKILGHFKLSPDEAVLVGDTIHDVVSAKKAGLENILVGNSYPDSAQPTYKINNLSELLVNEG